MKRIAPVALIVVVAVAAGLWLWLGRNGAPEAEISASGTVEATEVDLGFQIPGRVAEVVPHEGDQATAGDTLARLEATELHAARDAAAAQLRGAEARLTELRRGGRPQEIAAAEAAERSARRQAEEAARDAERTERLFEGGAVSAQALDRARTARDVAQSALEQAEQNLALVREGPRQEEIEAQEALVEQARARLAETDATLEHATVEAPFDGRVTIRHREPGESVGAGSPVLTVMNPSDRWVRIYVPEDRIGRVALGMAARISSDTYPDRGYTGEVVFIGDEAEFTPRNVQTTEERTRLVYRVKVQITGDPDFELKPGMPADVLLGADSGSAPTTGTPAGP